MIKKIEILLRKIILKFILLFNKEEKKEVELNLNENSKILFIRLNRIGDALVTTPLYKYLKDKYHCQIHILADKKNHFAFLNNKYIDKIFVWDKSAKLSRNILKKLNSGNYDALIDTHDDVSTTVSLIVTKLKIPYKISFAKGNENIFTKCVERPDSTTNHIIVRNLSLLEPFKIKVDTEDANVYYQPMRSSYDYLEDYFEKHNLNGKYLVGINISAGSEARFWGIGRFKELLKSLSKFDVTPVLLCSPPDIRKANEIAQNEYHVFYNESFDIFAAMISKLNFLFTPDTSVVHLASAFNIPMFGIYVKYNTDDMVWYPYQSEYDLVITEEEDFTNLESENVIKKFLEFFEKVYNETNSKL